MHSQLLPIVAVPPGSEDESGAGFLGEKRDVFSENINLDLRIGSSTHASEGGLKKRNKKIKQEKKESLFTAAQFREFYNQILVYNSITLALPVAFHLLLPIWMSVFNLVCPPIYKKYPSLAGLTPHSSDHSGVMDSGPGRCRRTDGRKWRCSKNALPYQKYCERHMHRGRQGSRKHVEPIKSISRPDNITSDDNNNKSLIMSSIASDMDNRIDLDQNQPCSDYINDIPANFNCRNDENRDDLLAIAGSHDMLTVGNEVENNTDSKKIFATSEGGHAKGKSSCEDANLRKIVCKKQSVGRNEYVSFVSSRFGSSPRSVLHSASGKVDPNLDSKNVINMEKQRCRRTDGKKWQCRRDAIPNQKYCAAHMHRGAKKFVLNPQTVSDRVSLAQRSQTCSIVTKNLDNGINLNSVPTSPQCITGNDSSSSTSDATTITDENISFCLARSLCDS